jgi:hypothetical protein
MARSDTTDYGHAHAGPIDGHFEIGLRSRQLNDPTITDPPLIDPAVAFGAGVIQGFDDSVIQGFGDSRIR